MVQTEQIGTRGDDAAWVRDRPHIPGYGVPDDGETVLAWTDVADRLAGAKNYWICTARDGRPHAVPVWAAFIGDTIYFGAGPRSKRNIADNPRVSVHLESADQVVIAEGVVSVIQSPDPELSRAIDDQYAGKYDWRPSDDGGDPVGKGWFALTPTRVFAWTSFPADATRWTRTPA